MTSGFLHKSARTRPRRPHSIFCVKNRKNIFFTKNRKFSHEMENKFGLLFDIDGVLLRGKEPIPVAAEALKMVYQVTQIFGKKIMENYAFQKSYDFPMSGRSENKLICKK